MSVASMAVTDSTSVAPHECDLSLILRRLLEAETVTKLVMIQDLTTQ